MIERGKHQQNKFHQRGMGTSQLGVCSCPQCKYSVTHKRGVPCATLLCPECNIPLRRQAQSENNHKRNASNKYSKNSSFPKIDTEICIGCGACVDICPSDAIHLEEGKAQITSENCKNCKDCISVCPVSAIT